MPRKTPTAPWRKVVDTTEHTMVAQRLDDAGYTITTQTTKWARHMECGHIRIVRPGGKQPKRLRCKECGGP